jgi:hypothetical protein
VKPRTNVFGNFVVVAFLLAQAFDGVLTYVGAILAALYVAVAVLPWIAILFLR